MLAERYGLYSDDSEDADAEDEPEEAIEANQSHMARLPSGDIHRTSAPTTTAEDVEGVEDSNNHHQHHRHHQVATSSSMPTPPSSGHSLNGPSHHSSSNGNGRRSDPASSDSVQMHYHAIEAHSVPHSQPLHHIPQHHLSQPNSSKPSTHTLPFHSQLQSNQNQNHQRHDNSVSAPAAAGALAGSAVDKTSSSSVTVSTLNPVSIPVTSQPAVSAPVDPSRVNAPPKTISSASNASLHPADDVPPPPQSDAFPPIELVDVAQARKICAKFSLPSSRISSPVSKPVARDARVTQVALYSSQLLESHGRKIAVSDHILSYAVGGHIRAILRHLSARCLLKGHSSVVADIEFLSFMESRLDNETADHISILGSVADDGSVYVWKLVRSATSLTSSNLSSGNVSSSSNAVAPSSPLSATPDSASNGTSNCSTTANSTNTKNCSFNIADAIRFEHPEFDKGKCYKRIAFRPGPNSIIAENGIGVAMLLLDMGATDLRIVELVKMNDKMMVRDKFLRARNEFVDGDSLKAEGNLLAAAWLSETVVVTSRGVHVFLWNAENTLSSCFARVPRESTSPVTAIYTLDQDVLLFVTSNGRGVEVWERKETSSDMSSTTLQLNQTIQLFDDKGNNDSSDTGSKSGQADIHCVSAIDPSCQIVLVSNVRQQSMLVLHYNKTAKAFDTITEIPLKNYIYSCSVGPVPTNSPMHRVPGSVGGSSVASNGSGPELGVWCIQPTGIQVVHLPGTIGRPNGPISNEIFPSPVPKTVGANSEKKMALLSPSQIGPAVIAAKSGADPSAVSVKRLPRTVNPKVPENSGNAKISGATVSPTVGSTVGASSTNPTTGTKAVGNLSNSRGATSGGHESHNNGVTKSDGGKGGSSQSGGIGGGPGGSGGGGRIGSVSNNGNADEIVEALLNAAKKAIATFEESAVLRSANEKVKAEKLMETVAETAESNMEAFINSSMKKVLAETLIPGVSEIIADSRKGMKEKARIEAEVTREYFEEVIEQSDIANSFGKGCKEMSRQVGHTVSTSLTDKFDCIVVPAVDVVNEAVDDLNGSVVILRDEVNKVQRERGGRRRGDDFDDDDDDNLDDDDDDDNNLGEAGGGGGSGRRRRKRRGRRGGVSRNNGPDQDLSELEPEPEDVRQIIDDQLARGAVDDAFLSALDKQDVGLVMWLCSKFEVSSFFVEHTLSQVALMSLASQLGQELMVGDDVVRKVDWLLEVMIALEPESEEIESISMQAVQELSAVVNEMRKNYPLMAAHVGLDRKLKTLARLVASQLQN